jgi:hypothetical protein
MAAQANNAATPGTVSLGGGRQQIKNYSLRAMIDALPIASSELLLIPFVLSGEQN